MRCCIAICISAFEARRNGIVQDWLRVIRDAGMYIDKESFKKSLKKVEKQISLNDCSQVFRSLYTGREDDSEFWFINSLLFVQVLLVIFFNAFFYAFAVLSNFIWVYAVANNCGITSNMLYKGVFGKHLGWWFELRSVEDLLGLFIVDTFPYVDPVFVYVVTTHEVAQYIPC